jgi:hypothetical protein
MPVVFIMPEARGTVQHVCVYPPDGGGIPNLGGSTAATLSGLPTITSRFYWS